MSAGRPGSVDSLAIGRDAQEITGELVLNGPEGDSDPDLLLDLAFHAAVLLRLRCASSTYAPAAADVSWDTVAAHDGDVRFVGLDEPASRVTASAHDFPVNQVDAEWVSASFVPALRLRDFEHSRRFGLAFNIAYAWNHSSDPRLAIANIWVGLEALFGDQGDRPVTRNLVRRITEWNGCDANEVTGLYNVRCDAVHGRWVETADLAAPIDAAWQLLRQSLVRAIDVEDVPLPDWGAGV